MVKNCLSALFAASIVVMSLTAGRDAYAFPQCTWKDCNDKRPDSSCAAGATTLKTAVIRENGVQVGIVELRGSSTCGAKWPRVTLDSRFFRGQETATFLKSGNDTFITFSATNLQAFAGFMRTGREAYHACATFRFGTPGAVTACTVLA